MSHITVRRKGGFADLTRAYKILVDGVAVGAVNHDDKVSLPVLPGVRSVQLKIDWCTSPALEVNVAAGETALLDCGNSVTVFTTILYITIWRGKYLWLRQTPSTVRSI